MSDWRKRPDGTGAPARTSAMCQAGDEPSAQRRPLTDAAPIWTAQGVEVTPMTLLIDRGMVAAAAWNSG